MAKNQRTNGSHHFKSDQPIKISLRRQLYVYNAAGKIKSMKGVLPFLLHEPSKSRLIYFISILHSSWAFYLASPYSFH